MIGDGTIPAAPNLRSFADRTVITVGSGHKAVPASMLHAGAFPEGCTDKAPTPFFDLLTTMIQAHAAETGRAVQSVGAGESWQTGVDAAPAFADHRWRAHYVNVCVAALIVVLGGMFYASEAGNEQSPTIPADEAF